MYLIVLLSDPLKASGRSPSLNIPFFRHLLLGISTVDSKYDHGQYYKVYHAVAAHIFNKKDRLTYIFVWTTFDRFQYGVKITGSLLILSLHLLTQLLKCQLSVVTGCHYPF